MDEVRLSDSSFGVKGSLRIFVRVIGAEKLVLIVNGRATIGDF